MPERVLKLASDTKDLWGVSSTVNDFASAFLDRNSELAPRLFERPKGLLKRPKG
jgi:hypothetical protein